MMPKRLGNKQILTQKVKARHSVRFNDRPDTNKRSTIKRHSNISILNTVTENPERENAGQSERSERKLS